jgi:hypothetical protein
MRLCEGALVGRRYFDRKSGHLMRQDTLARRPTVAALVRVEFDVTHPSSGLHSGRLDPCFDDSACPYKFAREGLFGSLPPALAFLP